MENVIRIGNLAMNPKSKRKSFRKGRGHGSGNGKTATVEAITSGKKQIDHATVGGDIGLLIPALTKKDVKKGDVIEK